MPDVHSPETCEACARAAEWAAERYGRISTATNRERPRPDVYCASPQAIKAAALAYGPENNAYLLADALIAAHHENLGEERSVCLRDVIEALENAYHPQNPVPHHPADFLRREFGAGES